MKQLNNKPTLAFQYEKYVFLIYNIPITVKKKQYPKFQQLELDLQRKGIRIDMYAKLTCLIWHSWVLNSKFNVLPQNVFLGPKALELFELFWAMKTVDFQFNDNKRNAVDAAQAEYAFACSFLTYRDSGGNKTENLYLKDYLKTHNKWWESSRFPLVQEVLQRLKQGYYKTAGECYTYEDLLDG